MERVARSLTAGVGLLPWQRTVVATALELLPNGRMAYPVVVVHVPRRAGKTLLTLARQFQRLSMPGRHCWYTAQRREDAARQFRDEWVPLVDASPWWRHTVKVRRAAGSEGFTHRHTGSRLQLFPPTEAALHGQNADDVTVDEAWFFDVEAGQAVEAGIRPAQLTRAERQTWIMSAGGTEDSTWLDHWMILGAAAVAEDHRQGVAFFDWSADPAAPGYDPSSPATWAAAHPALGLTIDVQAFREDFATMDLAAFERSMLGVWPRPSSAPAAGLDPVAWARCADRAAVPDGREAFALDVARDRSHAALVVAGDGPDGCCVLEVVEHRAGLDWLPGALQALRARWRGAGIVADELHCASVLADAARARVTVTPTGVRELTAACSAFADAVLAGPTVLRHRADPGLDAAVAGAARRNLGDAWAWSRSRSSAADISPLVAATLAAWRWRTAPRRRASVIVVPA